MICDGHPGHDTLRGLLQEKGLLSGAVEENLTKVHYRNQFSMRYCIPHTIGHKFLVLYNFNLWSRLQYLTMR